MIDPRGPRFAARETTVVLAAQAPVFALGASGHHPYVLFWKALLGRQSLRRTPPAELEDATPLRFAQLVGLPIARLPIARLPIAQLKVERTTNREGATA